MLKYPSGKASKFQVYYNCGDKNVVFQVYIYKLYVCTHGLL